MRNLRTLDRFRLTGKALPAHWRGYSGDHTCGAFMVPSPIDRADLRVIASSDLGWEHVSVSRLNRCPNWPEMSFIKDLFFSEDETVMQLHVPKDEHVNDHPNCLHLWRPATANIPRPPAWMVGGCSPAEALAAIEAHKS